MDSQNEVFGVNPENDPPKDDRGMRTEQVIDICDYTIRRCWREIFEDVDKDKMPIEKLEKLLTMTFQAWSLATDAFRYNLEEILEDVETEIEDEIEDDSEENDEFDDESDDE